MNLVLDIGNTLAKLASFQEDQLIAVEKILVNDVASLYHSIEKMKFKNCIFSSVVHHSIELLSMLKNNSHLFIEFDNRTRIPIKNGYKTPESLGKDRLALAVAGAAKFPSENVLVIDAGSCVTFDFVTANMEYLGGSISPGLEMRFNSLNQFTAKLPLVQFDNNYSNLIGKDTESSIRSGVQHGLIREIEGTIADYLTQYTGLKIILTGGNTNYLSTYLKSCNFADENFLLHGLNQILKFNV